MNLENCNYTPSTELAGIDSIFVIDTFTVVAFTNGAVAMSDEGSKFSSVRLPNLRQIDHDNWTYKMSQGL